MKEGLDEESLALFDILIKPDLTKKKKLIKLKQTPKICLSR
jgi:hypothetical protein